MRVDKRGCKMTAGKVAAGAILAVSLSGFGTLAQAALVSCPAAYTANGTAKVAASGPGTLTAASNCQYLTPADNNNVASIAHINSAGFFGTTNWQENVGNTQIDTPNQSTGTWSIANFNFASFDYIIVFKDGKDTNLVGFLLNESYSSGVWSTPFTAALTELQGLDKNKDVSHYTIARRASTQPPCIPTPGFPCGEQEVPEPGTLTLLGIGALGAAFLGRRRRKASTA